MVASLREASPVEDEKDAMQVNHQALPFMCRRISNLLLSWYNEYIHYGIYATGDTTGPVASLFYKMMVIWI